MNVGSIAKLVTDLAYGRSSYCIRSNFSKSQL